MSARSDLARKIAEIILEMNLAQIYGGSVTEEVWMTIPAKGGKPARVLNRYSVGMSICRWLDGDVKVNRETEIVIGGAGPHAYNVIITGKDMGVRFAAFCYAAWVRFDSEMVDRVLHAKDKAELAMIVPDNILALGI